MHPQAAKQTRGESPMGTVSAGEYDRLVENVTFLIESLVTLDLHYEAYQVQAIRDRIIARRVE
jgi:hypothetical protein